MANGKERDEKAAVILKYLELQNRRDYRGIEAIHHNPYVNKTFFGRHAINPKAHTRSLRGYFKVFPDATTESNQILAVEGDIVVVRTTARGTQDRAFKGDSIVGGPGKQIAVSLVHAIEVVDGKIASCEATNPFENQWTSEIVNVQNLGPDNFGHQNVLTARARQGIDSSYEILLERLVDLSKKGKLSKKELQQISAQLDAGPNQCQALVEPSMRRCAKQRTKAQKNRVKIVDVARGSMSLYCDYHQFHGYGID